MGLEEGSSSMAEGSRSLYNEIWKAKVPPKVRIFSWRLSQDGLATQCNRKRRTLADDAVCQLCGREDETGYHAVVSCTKSRALRHEMIRHWLLPDEGHFRSTGPD
jgi:5-methylcytosine-specific restriction endonuclease McrA